MKALTSKQRAILAYIKRYIARERMSPTFQDIGDKFGINASGAHQHVKALIKKGAILPIEGRQRAVRIDESFKEAK